jgi:hypothetical protein
MEVSSGKHKGIGWKCLYFNQTDPGFVCKCAVATTIGDKMGTEAEAVREIKAKIDNFVSEQPSTDAGWVDLLSDCMVWTGYEDCHIDGTAAMMVLRRFAKTGGK